MTPDQLPPPRDPALEREAMRRAQEEAAAERADYRARRKAAQRERASNEKEEEMAKSGSTPKAETAAKTPAVKKQPEMTEAQARAALKKHEAGMKKYRVARAEGVAKDKRPNAADNTAWNHAYAQLRKLGKSIKQEKSSGK